MGPQPELFLAQEQVLRLKVKEIVGSDVIKAYRTLDLSYTFRDAAFIHALLATTIAASCWLFLVFGSIALLCAPVGALLCGIAFNWINVQIHEASHGLLLRDRNWNDIYCNVALGSWGLQDVQTYRATHGMHHAHLHTGRDPDLSIYTLHTGSLRQIFGRAAEDLLLITALRRKRQVASFIAENDVPYEGVPHYATLAKLGAQGIVLGVYVYMCGLWGLLFYGAVYLYGLLGVFPLLVRIRTVVQHHGDELEHLEEGRPFPFISRTTVAPVLEFILIGARMDYHFEHHLYPTLPCYSLRKMHAALTRAGLFDQVREHGGPALRTETCLSSYKTLAT